MLKVAFYSLGLPLFVLAVFFSAVRFIGRDPFMGETPITTGLDFFKQIESTITAPALYGVWIAFAVWAVIAIIHIVLSKTVKNPRVRMLSVIAACMAVMLLTVVIIDSVYTKKIEALQAAAPEGVVVKDYKDQLSTYRNLSSGKAKKADTYILTNQVDLFKKAYNVEMEGIDKGGVSGNISNKPITYYNIIDDEGNQGVDISFRKNKETGLYELDIDNSADHNITGNGDLDSILNHTYGDKYGDYKNSPEYNQLVRLEPNANGQLVINGKVYSQYWYKEKSTKSGQKIYVWYAKLLSPTSAVYENGTYIDSTVIDGVYGKGLYNYSGTLSDGWVFSIYNALEILEDYYQGQATAEKYADQAEELYNEAVMAREKYYTQDILTEDPENGAWIKAIYEQEVEIAENFSLPRKKLDYLIAKVGAMLGDNHLFDFLLKPTEDDPDQSGIESFLYNLDLDSVADMIGPILNQLKAGMSLGGLINNDETMATVAKYVKGATGLDDSVEINDMFIVLAYAGATDAFGVKRDGMYLALVKDSGTKDTDGKYTIGTNSAKAIYGGDVLLDIYFNDGIISEDEESADYDFDLDHLSDFLNTAIDGLLGMIPDFDLKELLTENTIGKLLGGLLIKDMTVNGENYKGLEISGIQIPLFNEEYEAAIDISSILTNLLTSLYYYQSPVIKPVWEFYGLRDTSAMNPTAAAQYLEASEAFKSFQRAEYEAVQYGSMIGSTLVGDSIGAGTYPSSLGLTDLTSVQQLKWDLSYKREAYPIYAVRDCLLYFTGTVILFYFLSFVCAEKEREYANGTLVAPEKKARKNKKSAQSTPNSESVEQNTQPDAELKENPEIPVAENTDKEVL